MHRTLLFTLLAIPWLALAATPAAADTFGSGANQFTIPFVTVGHAGNAPDENPNPAGAVPYAYRIGKYEISERMIDAANAAGGLGLTKDTRGPDFPATNVTWYEAARFVNWLNTSSGSAPAYKFDAQGEFQLWLPADAGYNAGNLYRNSLARYFLPSLDEWHKAAYYNPVTASYFDYPTGSDSVPDGIDFAGDTEFDAVFFDGGSNPDPNEITNVGLMSPYGSAGQGGNVTEWLETAFDRTNDSPTEHRRENGGNWSGSSTGMLAWNGRTGIAPSFAAGALGLRVGSRIPEPNSAILSALLLLPRWCGTRIRRESQ
jgi:sulfatase modifying factor 1